MEPQKNLYALLIGINNYPGNPLAGCINDVLVVDEYFRKLCKSQPEEINWHPKFLLAPLSGEQETLAQQEIDYSRPTRQNVIDAFAHFDQADGKSGDICLLYYSGHGSYIYTDQMPLFEDYEPSGELQSLVCLDEDEKSKTLHHLLDKELGYLIAKTLDRKNPSNETGQRIHFISIMDCCHSGTNTRTGASQIKARMHGGSGVLPPNEPIGFTKTGNCFYRPFENNQTKVQPGGLTYARHISLAASQSSESSYEMPLSMVNQNGSQQTARHGIFTLSLIKTLEQSGTNISYRELSQRVQMEVRSRVDKQIPMLDTMLLKDSDLYFLRNQFSSPKQQYLVSFREKNKREWILNAGAIQGIIPSNGTEITTICLEDNTQRVVAVKEVRPTESVLDDSKFLEKDKGNKLLRATIHEMAFPTLNIAYGESLPSHMRAQIEKAWQTRRPKYINLVESTTPYQLEINRITNKDGSECFILTRPGGTVPLFERHELAEVLLSDADKVAKYETIVQMNNPVSTIPREDFEVKVKVLEGVPFDANTLNGIPDQVYRSADPEQVDVYFKKAGKKYVQPAIKVSVTCTQPMKQVYWIGALYCDAQYGITDQYLPVQQIGKYQTDKVELEFTMLERGQIKKWQSIPLLVASEWHQLGVTEIQDCIIIFISDAHQPFSLEKYNQDKIALDITRGTGFLSTDSPKKDSWRTIKIPIRISWPKDKVELLEGDQQNLSALSLETNSRIPFNVQITNAASAKRRVNDLQEGEDNRYQKSLLPPGSLWNNVEGGEEVFSMCPSGGPDMQLNILELTQKESQILDGNTTLTITPRDLPDAEEVIIPFGFDAESGLHLPLGHTNLAGQILVEQLPPISPGIIGADGITLDEQERSLQGSIKLFFRKLIWSKLSGRHDYHQLSWWYKENEIPRSIIYDTTTNTTDNKYKIKEQIAQSKEVLLLVHGITGDTEEMVDMALNHLEENKKFDTILAFDYENLCSSIPNIAKSLKKILLDCGIQQKQLTIVAHSMGGLVTRWMIEKEGGAPFVKKLIQAGTPNGGTEISALRKKMTGWLILGINGLSSIQKYMPMITFLSQKIRNPLFISLNDMDPKSKFLKQLNQAQNQTDVPYTLIAGKTSHIEAIYQETAPMYKKLAACLRNRGHYILADFFHGQEDNDFVVPVESMEALPWGFAEIQTINCDHFGYFRVSWEGVYGSE